MSAKKISHISTGVQDLIINFVLLTATCSSTIHTECVAAFPLPKWLHELTTILRCAYIILFEIAWNFTIPAENRRFFLKPYYLSYCSSNNNYLSNNHIKSHVITRNKRFRYICISNNPLWVWCAVMAVLNNTHTLPHHKPKQEWGVYSECSNFPCCNLHRDSWMDRKLLNDAVPCAVI